MVSLPKRAIKVALWIISWRILTRLALHIFSTHCGSVPWYRFLPLECEVMLEIVRSDFSLTRLLRQVLMPVI